MPKDFGWAVNKEKLQRAEKEVTTRATDPFKPTDKQFEEAVKEVYVRLLGLVQEDRGSKVRETADEDLGDLDVEDMNVKQLKAYAKSKEIDISGLTTKDDILNAIDAVEAK